ncbi:DEAD/DEAH box helicase [Maribrevibacterium harenarium]|uniref:DEAD/DEAH box helicase n=1 Tax=Maribrevibacterium harenarium TaxID=2589817 RepID=A0A501X546_9GAMM|nr:DEAD/DEAH box helicase [Maribrevibacterium harenarium]TPE55563.1 DEAD/DEAH box helicase [Maribrevibacterium harenarium]
MSFSNLELDFTLEQALADMGITAAKPIQEAAIPPALEGLDIIACAPTGTGKTLAFALPAIQHILDRDEQSTLSPKVLILAPSRELARQTHQQVQHLLSHTRIQLQLIVGGTPYGNQQQQLSEVCDILVATPGRLAELNERGWLDLSDTSFLVIDEADRMLEMGFADALTSLEKELPAHQTLFFSATLDNQKLGKFGRQFIRENAAVIDLSESPRAVSSLVSQKAIRVDDDEHKLKVLSHLLQQESVKQALVFVNNRDHVETWVNAIRKLNIRARGLHGEMKQSDRTETVKQMQKDRIQVLVATDVAARGINLVDINTVINLRLPRRADTYIHRAGRASREGEPGNCFSLVDIHDLPMIEKIQRFMGSPIKFTKITGLEPKTKARGGKKGKKKN